MINRREFLERLAGAGAALAFTPSLLGSVPRAAGGPLLQRAIPSTGEMLPVIGLGRGWARSLDAAALKETIRVMVEGGGKLLDTVHGGPPVRELVGAIARDLGVQSKIFWSTGLLVPGAPPGPQSPPSPQPGKADPAAVRAEAEKLFGMLKVTTIDLVQVPIHADVPTHLAILRELKKEGRVRSIGVTDLLPPPNVKPPPGEAAGEKLASIMREEPLDFVGIEYSLIDRRAEEMLLPLAQERKIGVLAYFPFDRSRIFQRIGAAPLPEWAAEFDATTWAQFFLKYVISHPAVTVARASTSSPAHMLDNLGGGAGRLPDEAMRKRMAELADSWPAPSSPAPSRGGR